MIVYLISLIIFILNIIISAMQGNIFMIIINTIGLATLITELIMCIKEWKQ